MGALRVSGTGQFQIRLMKAWAANFRTGNASGADNCRCPPRLPFRMLPYGREVYRFHDEGEFRNCGTSFVF